MLANKLSMVHKMHPTIQISRPGREAAQKRFKPVGRSERAEVNHFRGHPRYSSVFFLFPWFNRVHIKQTPFHTLALPHNLTYTSESIEIAFQPLGISSQPARPNHNPLNRHGMSEGAGGQRGRDRKRRLAPLNRFGPHRTRPRRSSRARAGQPRDCR